MKLSRQLLLVSLLVLVLPLAGINWVQDMALTLREQQVQVLNASLRATAASLALRDTLPNPVPAGGVVYAQSSQGGLILDGYFEDWQAQDLVSRAYGLTGQSSDTSPPVKFNAAADGSNLYLAFHINNQLVSRQSSNKDSVLYYSPVGKVLENGDRVQLFMKSEQGQLLQYVIVTEAPGPVIARTRTTWNGIERVVREYRIRGAWREIQGGYQLELMMPLTMAGKQFGFRVIKGSDESWIGSSPSLSSSTAAEDETSTLVLPDRALSETLKHFLEPDMRLGIINSAGWQIAETGEAYKPEKTGTEPPVWVVEWLFKTLLRWDSLPEYQSHWRDGGWQNSVVSEALKGQPQYFWLKDNSKYRLLSAWPLEKNSEVVGALVAEQGSHALLAITWKSLNKLFSLSFWVVVLAAVGLLGYASWLSFRIRKLNKATERCIARDGRLRADFPVSQAGDEVGELSRSINTMLARLEEHTDYLRTLGSKLSHELRTPLAVVRSSLDNLRHENTSTQAKVYADRAMAGADRLGSLLNSISEATRLETMIDDMAGAEKEEVDLRQMLDDLCHAYSGVYPRQRFALEIPEKPCSVTIVPDLVVQAMDKLISNAVDFCPEKGKIILRLISLKGFSRIEVENDGELLADSMQESLFDSMVSVRKARGDKAHLGLGLYIVRLVMACHNGSAAGRNRDDKSGVVFQLQFPHKTAMSGKK